MIEAMLTTTDNPWDPFEDYDEWFSFDLMKGYHTPSYLARVAVLTDELSEAEYNAGIERAIDEIIELNLLGIYKKVTRESDPKKW